jgi:DNA-binding transcriptional LysR family regulator
MQRGTPINAGDDSGLLHFAQQCRRRRGAVGLPSCAVDKLKAMQTFVRIAEHGSLTAAARALDASLPSVVRTLAALERALQVRLFNRTTRRVVLTDEGRRYLEACRPALAAIDEADRVAGMGAQAASGRLTITAPVLFGQLHVAPAVTRFVQRHPHVQVDLVLLDRVANLLEEDFDAGIRIGALPDSSLVARELGHVRRLLVASPTFLRRHGRPAHPRDLARFNCLRGIDASHWTFHEDDRAFTVAVSGNLRFNHVAPTIDACVAGVGFGLFMSYQVGALVRRGALKIVLEAFETPPRPIHLVLPQTRLMTTRARLFVDAMVRELRGFKEPL